MKISFNHLASRVANRVDIRVALGRVVTGAVTSAFALVLQLPVAPFARGATDTGDMEPVCVIAEHGSLRSGPGLQFSVNGEVGKFTPLLKVDRIGAWLKVQDLNGDIHWISKSLVTRKFACAVVKTRSAKLRTAPGENQPLASPSPVLRRHSFRKVDRDGEWVSVQDVDNHKYWIHETNVWIPTARARVVF